MAHQTEYPDTRAAGYPGMLSDTGHYDNDSMTVVTADVPFGTFAAYGAADRTCRPLAAGDTSIAGAAIRVQGGTSSGNTSLSADEVDRYVVGDTASIMKKGRMYVKVTTAAVVAGDEAFAVIADSSAAKAGDIEVGIFETSAAVGEIAVVRIT